MTDFDIKVSSKSELDTFLASNSYLSGYVATDIDIKLIKSCSLKTEDVSLYPHLSRWHKHVQSFSESDIKSLAKIDLNCLKDCGISIIKKSDNKPKTNHSKQPKDGVKKSKSNENKKEGSEPKIKELSPWPSYIQERLDLWDKLKKESDESIAAKKSEPIEVTLPDGATRAGESWKSTPYSIAAGISQGLAESVVVAKVNGEVYDMERPLTEDCKLQLLKFDDDEAKTVFWHSTAHVLGEAMERVYGGNLCYGPPIEEGFYYDMHYDGPGVSQNDFSVIEEVMKKITKEKQTFERLEVS